GRTDEARTLAEAAEAAMPESPDPKAALQGMVESLALELAPRVRVNAIAPGVVAWPDGTPEPERAAYESHIPLARPGTPDDAARLVRTLVRDMHYVTGSVLRLDGGRWLR
ncbi:MAG: SDR family oxidoreductase, partial [Phycisphaerales bacterium]